MKHKITEIKNRTIYIEDCLAELKKVIQELEDAEVDKILNTTEERVNENFVADGTASEIDDDCEDGIFCKKYIPVILATGTISLLILLGILFVSQ